MFCCSSLVITALPLLLSAVGALSGASISPCWGEGTVVIVMCGLGFSALMGDSRWPESPGSFFSASGSPCFLFQALRISVLCYRCSNWRPACLLVSSLFFLLSFANMAFSSCLLQHNIHTDNIKIINKYNKNINKRSLQRVFSASLGKANVFCTTKQSDHDSSNYKCFISQVFKKDNVLI